jgi:hypothetical protein
MDQSQTVNANPLVQDTVQQNLAAGRDLLNNQPGTPEYYRGDAVADLNTQQENALDAMYARGMSGSGAEQGLGSYIQNALGQDYSGALGSAQGALGQMAQGGMSLQDAANFAASGSAPYSQALQSQASGQINPLTTAMYRDASQNLGEQFNQSVMPGINATFAQGGRTGGGLHQAAMGNAAGQLADAQGSLATNMFGQAAEGALQRQLAAGQSGLQGALAQQGLAGNLYNQGQDRALGAAGTLQQGALGGMGMQQGAAGLTGMLSGLDYQNLQNALTAGGQRQGQSQAEIDARMAAYEHNSSRAIQDWERSWQGLEAQSGLTSPLQGTGSTTSNADKWSKWS